MSGFSKEWLQLREDEDRRARDASLIGNLQFRSEPLRVIDLGAGSGSNLRYLAPRLPFVQHWVLADSDTALLSSVTVPRTNHRVTTEMRALDLAAGLSKLDLGQCDLVTASAFFDLVSEDWVKTFAKQCAKAKISNGLFVLNVDGRIAWTPEDDDDAEVTYLFNAHMQREKGFGPALGARATEVLSDTFQREGYAVEIGESPWRIASGKTGLQRALLEGYAAAASQQDPHRRDMIEKWSERRAAHIADGQSRLFVGHHDVLVRRG